MERISEWELARMSPQEREAERQGALAWDLIDALKARLPGRLPNRELDAVTQRTRRVMDIPRGSVTTLYPPNTGPIFIDTEGNRWDLNADNEGFSLDRWRPLPPTPEEPEVSISDHEFLVAQVRLSDSLFGTTYASWTSHTDRKDLEARGKATNKQQMSGDETTVTKGKEFIGRFVTALKAVPEGAEI